MSILKIEDRRKGKAEHKWIALRYPDGYCYVTPGLPVGSVTNTTKLDRFTDFADAEAYTAMKNAAKSKQDGGGIVRLDSLPNGTPCELADGERCFIFRAESDTERESRFAGVVFRYSDGSGAGDVWWSGETPVRPVRATLVIEEEE